MAEEQATTHDGILRQLEDNITGLDRLLTLVPDRDEWRRPRVEGWSPAEILVHMRAADEILSPRVLQILVRDRPPMPAFDERRWAEVAGYAAMPLEALFARIALRRFELLQVVRMLQPQSWDRAGIHEEHGPVTIFDLLTHMANHEAEHIAEIKLILGVNTSN